MTARPPRLTFEPIPSRRVRLVGLDVDGVLTDGGVYVGEGAGAGIELKRFDIQDGIGVRLLRHGGIRVVIVSGRVSGATARRAAELGIDDVVQDDAARKLPAFARLLARDHIRFDEAAFVGDDLPDIPVLERVGLPVAVRNAVPEVLDVAQYVTTRPGGHGAVREFAEALLRARGAWDGAVADYLAERGEAARVGGAHA